MALVVREESDEYHFLLWVLNHRNNAFNVGSQLASPRRLMRYFGDSRPTVKSSILPLLLGIKTPDCKAKAILEKTAIFAKCEDTEDTTFAHG